MNLTGITDRDQVYIKHFFTILFLYPFFVQLKDVKTVADIGSGAGFPSIPLKIAFPHMQVTIVDSLNKRITFLKHLVDRLGLKDVSCVHGRAEDVARMPAYRDQFDLVTARAVARLNALNELCLPFVKPKGLFVSMKGTDPRDEVKESEFSLKILQARLLEVASFQLPVEQSSRHLIIIEKKGGYACKVSS